MPPLAEVFVELVLESSEFHAGLEEARSDLHALVEQLNGLPGDAAPGNDDGEIPVESLERADKRIAHDDSLRDGLVDAFASALREMPSLAQAQDEQVEGTDARTEPAHELELEPDERAGDGLRSSADGGASAAAAVGADLQELAGLLQVFGPASLTDAGANALPAEAAALSASTDKEHAASGDSEQSQRLVQLAESRNALLSRMATLLAEISRAVQQPQTAVLG